MGRPRHDAEQTATTARLLEAAEAEFGERGFDRARLEDIAARVGISRPSLLYHFGTKDLLYAAVVGECFAKLGEAVAVALSGAGSFEDRVEAVTLRYVSFLEEHPHLATILVRESVDGRGPGRALLVEAAAPVIDAVEHFALESGRGVVGRGIPARAALMYLASSLLFRAASGPLVEPLWGGLEHHAREMARTLFAEGASHATV